MKQVAKFEKVSEGKFAEEISKAGLTACYTDIKLPQRATSGSAGYDFYAPTAFTLKAGESVKIPVGVRARIDEGWFLAIFPRSGLGFKYRLQLDNTVGIIDSDYYNSDNEGHIIIKVTNCSVEQKTLTVEKGQGFAQGIFLEYGITTDDAATSPRNGGFGSTTK